MNIFQFLSHTLYKYMSCWWYPLFTRSLLPPFLATENGLMHFCVCGKRIWKNLPVRVADAFLGTCGMRVGNLFLSG